MITRGLKDRLDFLFIFLFGFSKVVLVVMMIANFQGLLYARHWVKTSHGLTPNNLMRK